MSSTTTRTRPVGGRSSARPARRLFTADEYVRMAETGILGSEERVELLNGEIWQMAPIGSKHFACVNSFNAWFVPALIGRAIVSVQNPIRLSSGSMPQPDLVLMRPRPDRYANGLPGPEEIFLVVEVSDTTLRYDRDRKLPLYAAAGIPEVWIANLEAGSVLIGRDPSRAGYRRVETVTREGVLSPAAFPDLAMPIGDILG